MTLHLLTLPREIRDIIYQNVHRPDTLEWPWKTNRNIFHNENEDVCEILRIVVHNLPCSGLLLAHPQLNAEYNTPQFQDISAQVTLDIVKRAVTRTYTRTEPSLCAAQRTRLAHIRHLTAIINYPRGQYWEISESTTPYVRSFRGAILRDMPNLVTVRFLQRHCGYVNSFLDFLPIQSHRMDGPRKLKFLPAIPWRFGSLPLAQHGEGLRYGHEGWRSARNRRLDLAQKIVTHTIRKIRVSVWSKEFTETSTRFWTHEEILEVDDGVFPCLQYAAEILELMTPKLREVYSELPGKLVEWKETRGKVPLSAARPG